ncbi:MAG: nickel-type superoxide dismutase maturation protease [Nitriliruptoraceae bacterium]
MVPSAPTSRWRRRAPWLAAALGCYLGALAADRSRIVVRGESMLPRLWPGDVLVTVPAILPLRAGQVVVARDPDDPGHRVVKRVEGVGDGRVVLRGDHPDRSTDSRRWGPVPRRLVRRVAVRRWPDLGTPLTVRRTVEPAFPPPRPDAVR